MSLLKPLPGDDPSRSTRVFGGYTDAVADLRKRQQESSFNLQHTEEFQKGAVIKIRNSAAANVPWYGVLQLGNPRMLPAVNEVGFKEQCYLNGTAPNGYIEDQIGIAQEPINTEVVGEVVVCGITQCRVYVENEAAMDYEYAVTIAGDVTRLKAASIGRIKILWKENAIGNVWAIIQIGFSSTIAIRRFELKYDLAPGETKEAYELDDDGVDTGVEFEVTDHWGIHRGRARGKYDSPNNQGSRGYTIQMPDNNEWEIWVMQPSALKVRGNLYAAVTGGAFQIDGIDIMQPIGGLITDEAEVTYNAGLLDVTNPFSMEGDEDGQCVADWNESTGWEATQMECPTL